MKLRVVGLSILLVLPFLADSLVKAQENEKADSLFNVINHSKDDKAKAGALLVLAKDFTNSRQYDSALLYNNKARELSIKINDQIGLAETYKIEYLIFKARTDYLSAKKAIFRFIQLVKPLNDSVKLNIGYYNYAGILQHHGEIDSVCYYLHECLKMNKNLKNPLTDVGCYNILGMINIDLARYDSAVFYYMQAIKVAQEADMKHLLGRLYTNLGKSYKNLEDYDVALKYLEMAHEYNTSYKDTMALAWCYEFMGEVFQKQNKLDQALNYFDKSYAMFKIYGEIREIIDLYQSYGLLYKQKGDYTLALKNYKKALAYYKSQDLADGTIVTMKNMGDIYKRMNNYKLAGAYLDSSLNIAVSKGFKHHQMDIYTSLHLLYYHAGDYRQAYDYQTEAILLQDTLFNLDKAQLIEEMTLKFDREQDQLRILALEKENLQKDLSIKQRTIQRNALLSSVLILLIVAVFLFVFINQRRRKDRIIAQQKIQQLEEEKKLLAAKSLVEGQEEERKRIALELHDGLGVLLSATKMQFTSIRDTSVKNKPLIERATQLLEQAAGDVRKISHNMMPGLLMKLGLYEAVEDLFENINDTHHIKAICSIPEGFARLPENQEIMLYRIIQEMVNNTLKHAEARTIHLQFSVLESTLVINYSDNGKGFDPGKMAESKSLGLKSIQSRVDFLGGKLSVESLDDQGTSYRIALPFMPAKND